MGARGPLPKPTPLRVGLGPPPGGNHKLKPPKANRGRPPRPEELSDDAKKEWDRVVPILEEMGILSPLDMAALAGYCHAYAEFNSLQEFLRENGYTETSKNGFSIQRPQVAIMNQAAKFMQDFAKQFGLTPASRSRMTMPEQDDDDGSEFDV
jgi:P27 family predicted phage terminase small subunit